MEHLKDKHYPIEPHDSWWVVDSSKMQDYLRCPRYYFFRHIVGWEEDKSRIHLEFGTAMHKAVEHLLLNGTSAEAIREAFLIFYVHYREHFPEDRDDKNFPKNPVTFAAAIVDYSLRLETESYKVVLTETSGAVPISLDPPRSIHFKLDSILEAGGKYKFRDLKSASRITDAGISAYEHNFQMGTYTHVLFCFFPPELIEGGEVDIIAFYKTKQKDTQANHSFRRIHLAKTKDMMLDYIWHVNHYFDMMEEDLRSLSVASPTFHTFEGFPKNPSACGDFGGCPYVNICSPNPIGRCQSNPPPGFVQRFWDPREKDKEAKVVVDPENIPRDKEEIFHDW